MNERRQQQRGGGGGGKRKPWNVCLIREYTTREGEVKTDFVRCGAAFENDGSFTGELYFTLPAGARFALFPPNREGKNR